MAPRARHHRSRRDAGRAVTGAPHELPPPSAAGRARGLDARDVVLALSIVIVTAAIYSQVRSYGFVNYDTPDYVTENAVVRAGWSMTGVQWAFTSMEQGNWHPLTWLSHMTDATLFGNDAGWQHLMNVLIHLATMALLFGTLVRMTGARWPAALVAFIFALHPLHVESVAWIAERKDVLCAFFWVLTMWMYARYAARPGTARYLAVAIAFGGGLMSKAMILTLPLVLVVLDWWPLRRRRALVEKLPLLAMSGAIALVTILAQARAGAVSGLDALPFTSRAANAAVSYVAYLHSFIWPSRLAVFYPMPAGFAGWQIPLAIVILAGITAGAWRARRTRPYLMAGWAWFVVTLLPVIGLLQVGVQARADRYTYIPLIGVSLAIAWLLADIVRLGLAHRRVIGAAVAVAGCACTLVTWRQIQHWRSTETLFRHAIEVTEGNFVAWNNLGIRLAEQRRYQDALAAFEAAIRARPRFADALTNRGSALHNLGRDEEALPDLRAAVALGPNLASARVNLGTTLNTLGRSDEALTEFQAAVERWPDSVDARLGLGVSLALTGRIHDAIAQTTWAVERAPANAYARYNLGQLLFTAGRPDEARVALETAVRLRPEFADAHFNLGNVLARVGRMSDAIVEYREAVRLKPRSVKTRTNLGSALAEAGRLDEAINQFSVALALAPGSPELRRNLERARSLRKKRTGQ